ncbi:hypothetical protein YN1HA_19520 [Sulfurisphaera ohwakuensis]
MNLGIIFDHSLKGNNKPSNYTEMFRRDLESIISFILSLRTL